MTSGFHAYDEALLGRARTSLGRMLDFAAHSLRIAPAAFLGLFTASGAAGDLARGDIRLITGMSGIELAYEVLDRSGLEYERITPRYTEGTSAEYWYGYALATYQWESALPFEEAAEALPAADFIQAYELRRGAVLGSLPWDLAEDERRAAAAQIGPGFVKETLAALTRQASGKASGTLTRLKQMRVCAGLSQSELARASGVPMRTIQQYEQRQKDINAARFEYLARLSAALNCDPLQLLER